MRSTTKINRQHFDYLKALIRGDENQLAELHKLPFLSACPLFEFVNSNRLWELFDSHSNGCDLLPNESVLALKQRLEKNALKREKLDKAFQEIAEAFQTTGEDALWLKGDVFGNLYWPNARLRHHYDLDILVRERNLNSVIESLHRCDFQMKHGRTRVRNVTFNTEHAVSLYRDGIGVDLHWHLRNLPAYRFDYGRIWAEARPMQVEELCVRTLSASDTFAAQLIGVFHDIGRGGFSLKGLLDLWLILRREYNLIDWPAFRAERIRERTWIPCLNVVSILLTVFDGREEFLQLSDWCRANEHLIAGSGDDVYSLLEQPRGSLTSYGWTCRVYPVSLVRDARFLIQRSIPHPGRIPVTIFRGLRFAAKVVPWLLQSTISSKKAARIADKGKHILAAESSSGISCR